ncbi:hypothetical protein X975_13927, partial [Stegodyphus mimosarum]
MKMVCTHTICRESIPCKRRITLYEFIFVIGSCSSVRRRQISHRMCYSPSRQLSHRTASSIATTSTCGQLIIHTSTYIPNPHLLPARTNGLCYHIFLQEVLQDVPAVVRDRMWFQHDGTPAHNHMRVMGHSRAIGLAVVDPFARFIQLRFFFMEPSEEHHL